MGNVVDILELLYLLYIESTVLEIPKHTNITLVYGNLNKRYPNRMLPYKLCFPYPRLREIESSINRWKPRIDRMNVSYCISSLARVSLIIQNDGVKHQLWSPFSVVIAHWVRLYSFLNFYKVKHGSIIL